jgi:hypothetical protein
MSTALARKFKIDVSTDGTTWTPLKGVNDFSPQVTPTNQDSSDYDTNGWSSSEKTMQAWANTIKVNRKTTAGVYDPGQEIVRAAHDQFGDAARVYTRWYDRTPGTPEAYSGLALVGWARSKTGVADLDEVTITLTGDGARTAITNPAASGVVPVILSAGPTAVTAAGLVTITGSGFVGTVATTGVKFGGVNATSWVVVSDSEIVAVMPTGSAGSAVVLVTNATGASTAFPYTRGA